MKSFFVCLQVWNKQNEKLNDKNQVPILVPHFCNHDINKQKRNQNVIRFFFYQLTIDTGNIHCQSSSISSKGQNQNKPHKNLSIYMKELNAF